MNTELKATWLGRARPEQTKQPAGVRTAGAGSQVLSVKPERGATSRLGNSFSNCSASFLGIFQAFWSVPLNPFQGLPVGPTLPNKRVST